MPSDKDARTKARHLLEGNKKTFGTNPEKDRTSYWSECSFYPSPTSRLTPNVLACDRHKNVLKPLHAAAVGETKKDHKILSKSIHNSILKP